ncbi:helix-turn-helix domain-containing protein [Pseudarthrobacter sp. WHRI 8279]|uniref:helix-turn-helix domain-containing protein n=1 Tax=Pseudarthrobacter sp. WHRI 8279 TaxID=3162566 RepID=UPI0032EC302F
MRDVATAAGVSVATVSNVMNHPHLVAARTRDRVRGVVRELDFQPDPHAKALRGLGVNASNPRRDTVPGPTLRSQEEPLKTPDHIHTQTPSSPEGLDPNLLEPGVHIIFRVGPEFLSGTVDAVMPDKSCFWIWTDCGMGRRMIDARDAASVGGETNE